MKHSEQVHQHWLRKRLRDQRVKEFLLSAKRSLSAEGFAELTKSFTSMAESAQRASFSLTELADYLQRTNAMVEIQTRSISKWAVEKSPR